MGDDKTEPSAAKHQTLCEGAVVMLHGLQTAALNGQQGVLAEFDKSCGRWHVRIGGQLKSLKPYNLVLIGANESEQPGCSSSCEGTSRGIDIDTQVHSSRDRRSH